MPVSDADNRLIQALVTTLLVRQPLDTSTDELARKAVEFEDRASTAVRVARDEAAKLAAAFKKV